MCLLVSPMNVKANDGTDIIDISECTEGIIIDSSNCDDYDNKAITGTAPEGQNMIIKSGLQSSITLIWLYIA